MTRTIQLAMEPEDTPAWRAVLEKLVPTSGLDLELLPDDPDPGSVDYLVYNIDSGITDFTPYTKLRAILNTWAGVEAVLKTIDWPAHVPFTRMVEPGMTQGMAEYFTGHAMRYHLDIDRFVTDSVEGRWQKWSPPLTSMRTVGILGLGELGIATAGLLRGLGFKLIGWSRSPKDLDGVACHHGADGLRRVLEDAEILVVILPLTPETENVLNAETLAWMPRGACIVNAGRGPLIDDDALLAALASGQIRHATLDVFREEPLPQGHGYWQNPGVTVTPHIASVTRPETACAAILEQIARDLDGKPLLHVVDRNRGY
ncbi:MAG: glyoxylate/hydroxypyruvate reductase A [Pseudomonadota bacterium]